MHLLTFDLSMEASEEFGFSGPKTRSLNLLPVSRQVVKFGLFPLAKSSVEGEGGEREAEGKGGRWIAPYLRVEDRYFKQVLKVEAAEAKEEEGGLKMRAEKRGVGIWVPVSGD